jgi:hypothetical protein
VRLRPRPRPPAPAEREPPKSFRAFFAAKDKQKVVARTFLHYRQGADGQVEIGGRTIDRTGRWPMHQRMKIELGPDRELRTVSISKLRPIAPKLQLVRHHKVKFGNQKAVVTTAAFGYAWKRTYEFPPRAVVFPRENPVGLMIAARRYDRARKGTQRFTAFDPVSGKRGVLTVQGKIDGKWMQLEMQDPWKGRWEVRYDLLQGGIVAVQRPGDAKEWKKTKQSFSVNIPPFPADAVQTAVFSWPQELKSRAIQVTTRNGVVLKGTLSLPKGRPQALVLLVGTQGRLDRDGTQGLRKPYAQLAAALNRNGFAVVRYDKRGIGGSAGSYVKLDRDTEMTDVMTWVRALKQKKTTRNWPLYLVGHGTGGLLAGQAAHLTRKVERVVMLATPGLPYGRVIKGRYRREWKAAALNRALIQKRLAYLDSVLKKIATGAYRRKTWLSLPVVWIRQMLGLQLGRIFRRVYCPVLVVYGTADVVVGAADAQALESAMKHNGRFRMQRPMAKVGHFLQISPRKPETAPEEWRIPSPIAKKTVEVLVNWLAKK